MLESYSWAFGEYLEVQKGARQFSSDNKIQLSIRVPAYASPDIRNSTGTQWILELARRSDARVFYASSSDV